MRTNLKESVPLKTLDEKESYCKGFEKGNSKNENN